MIPLRDENPSDSTPVVTWVLIAINVLVFGYEFLLGVELREFMLRWGLVPARVTVALASGEEGIGPPLLTFASSMFLHGGVLHVLGNMWYLAIFGDNVEDRLGSARYLVFYLAGGLAAAFVHYLTNAHSPVPTVGASGAVAAVLGAYLVTFPHARVITLVPLFPFFQIMALPAIVMLGFWFVYQFFSGALALAWTPRGGGIAWWAHIGGFVFGMLAMRLMAGRGRRAVRYG